MRSERCRLLIRAPVTGGVRQLPSTLVSSRRQMGERVEPALAGRLLPSTSTPSSTWWYRRPPDQRHPAPLASTSRRSRTVSAASFWSGELGASPMTVAA